MKLPNNMDKISIMKDDAPLGPYPPLGFIPFWEAELGNGDYFGLYWPLGKEDSEPIICDMSHDNWTLIPSFSSLNKFIEWAEPNDWMRDGGEIDDVTFSPNLISKAKSMISANRLEEAIILIEKACKSLPEVSEYWNILANQYRRIAKAEEAAKASLNAFNSNWVFNIPNESVFRSLKSGKSKEILNEDPLIQQVDSLNFKFGGVKENHDYDILKEVIKEYIVKSDYISALLLYQNYAYMMNSETTSFQERYNFKLGEWQLEFSNLCSKYLNDTRKIFS